MHVLFSHRGSLFKLKHTCHVLNKNSHVVVAKHQLLPEEKCNSLPGESEKAEFSRLGKGQ